MPWRRGVTGFLAGVTVLLLLVPASAPAGTLSATPEPNTYNFWNVNYLYERAERINRVALVTETPSGGSTDLVIGDVTAGIRDPIPSFCIRVNGMIVRCPITMIHGIKIDLGPGNDTLSAKGITQADAYDIAQLYILANLGKGRDVAVGGPGPNVISGGAGQDMIMGGPLADKLFGGGQNDFLVGLGGNDLFQCGGGPADLFNDGPGRDLVNVRTCEERTRKQFLP